MELNPLSHPKGIKYLCELCGKTAYLITTFISAYFDFTVTCSVNTAE